MGKIHEAIRLTYDQEAFLRQSQPPFAVAVSTYAPLVEYYLELGDTSAAKGAMETALGMVQAPMDQFLAFSEAMIQAREGDFETAEESAERGIVVIDRFKLKIMEFQVSITRARIADERGDHAAIGIGFGQLCAGDLERCR